MWTRAQGRSPAALIFRTTAGALAVRAVATRSALLKLPDSEAAPPHHEFARAAVSRSAPPDEDHPQRVWRAPDALGGPDDGRVHQLQHGIIEYLADGSWTKRLHAG
jgi:hypothetical protein